MALAPASATTQVKLDVVVAGAARWGQGSKGGLIVNKGFTQGVGLSGQCFGTPGLLTLRAPQLGFSFCTHELTPQRAKPRKDEACYSSGRRRAHSVSFRRKPQPACRCSATGSDGASSAEREYQEGVPEADRASTSGCSSFEHRHPESRAPQWRQSTEAAQVPPASRAKTVARWAGGILLGAVLVIANTQPAMAAWGLRGKGGVRDVPRPATVGLTDEQRHKQEEEAAARRAAQQEAAQRAREQEEERARQVAAAEAEQEEQRTRGEVLENIRFFRERNSVTKEWELPLRVFEEVADAGLVDRTLLGWNQDKMHVQLRDTLGPEAQDEYLVLIPYPEKKRILDKYTADIEVATTIGLGADKPRNVFEEYNFEAKTGTGRGQNLARKQIDLTIKHLGEYGPLWFLSKERIDPESLGFKDGEAMFVWLQYWGMVGLAATWGWFMFVDKDQKTERYWDKKILQQFEKNFEPIDSKNQVTLKDVAGLDHVVDELQEVITFLKYPEKFVEMGARPPRGMLLYGAPGTGKTLLARAIAGEANVPIIHIVASKFAMGGRKTLVGLEAANLRAMFGYAKHKAPIVIFLDEIDGLCKKRVSDAGDNIREAERAVTLNQLLVEMDGFNTYANKGILVIGATNNPEKLDPALTRPGRMDRIIEMPLPDVAGRLEILQLYNKGWRFLGPIDLHEIAERAVGLSPADMADIFEDAISDKIDHVTTSFRQIYDLYFRKRGPYYFLHPVGWIPGPWQRHIPRWIGRPFRFFFPLVPEDFQPLEDYCITQDDLRATVDFLTLEKETKRGRRSDKFWAPTVFHQRSFKLPFAAGLVTKAWMCSVLPNHPPIISMWIEKYEGESLAVCNVGDWPATEMTSMLTRRMLEKMLLVLVSTYVGLRILLPEDMHDTLLHRRDLKQAQRLAKEMCASTGYSFDDDATMWAGEVQVDANSYRRNRKVRSPAMGWAKQQELREMGDVLINLAINKAAELLMPHKEAMEELMERLMLHDRLDREDLMAHMKKHNVTPVDEFWLTPGGKYSVPEPDQLTFSLNGIIADPIGTPADLGPPRLTLAQLGTKYTRKYKQIIKQGDYVPAERWNDPELAGKAWSSAPEFATESVLDVTEDRVGVRST